MKTIEDVRKYFGEIYPKDINWLENYSALPKTAESFGTNNEIIFQPWLNISQAFEILEEYVFTINDWWYSIEAVRENHYQVEIKEPLESSDHDNIKGGFISIKKPKAIIGAILRTDDKIELLKALEKQKTHGEILFEMGKHHKKILEKQCEWVGITLDDIDLSKDDWYTDYNWTEDQRKEFEDWIVDYLKNNKEAREELMRVPSTREDWLYKVAGRNSLGWTFDYGWTQEEY
jgi:hypothetical protein